MSLIMPTDDGYRQAKSARRGKARLDSRFDEFISRFREKFGPEPLWLETDHIGGLRSRRRLNVVLERTREYCVLSPGMRGYDRNKQRAVAKLFIKSLSESDLHSIFRPSPGASSAVSRIEEIFVYFSDFEKIAKIEAHELVSAGEMKPFVSSLELIDGFWCVKRAWGAPIVFVQTDQQATTLKTSPVRNFWADQYFALVEKHDEFGYLKRAEIAIDVDSKENFDKNFASNWYYYFK